MLKGEIKPHEIVFINLQDTFWKVNCKSICHIYKIDLKLYYGFITECRQKQ